ncbi:nucleotidyltransferase substrate binding protein [Salinibacillus xinjiangensis]|uniref:Nucleotidyltransferase n=1 Tax=Salinibacillus xinjiangensis TaxID=1229268 RepID=A0A6G1X2N6_9BACI|nr:nucleotidyltransferase substrate binding protein [Salinibacillus xinjiangensis]MRG85257.1 hypothetical protein [Salinibacillus xinjiangensis]
MNDNEIRWRQIFENYEKAYNELNKHKDMIFETNLEKAGYIHYFEIAMDLAERVMLAYLDAKEKSVDTPRQAVKELGKLNIIQHHQIWFKAQNRKKLPLFIHKNEKLFDELVNDINQTYIGELESFWETLIKIK